MFRETSFVFPVLWLHLDVILSTLFFFVSCVFESIYSKYII